MEGLDPNKTGELHKAAMFAANTFGIEAALQKASNGGVKAKIKTARSAKPVKAKAKPVKSETLDKAKKDKPDKGCCIRII